VTVVNYIEERDCLAASWPECDVIITDPPYSEHTHTRSWGSNFLTKGMKRADINIYHRELGFEHLTLETMRAVARETARACRRWSIFFCDFYVHHLWVAELEAAGLEYVRTLVWDKVDGAPQFTGDRPAAGAELAVLAHRPGRKRWNGGGRRNVFRHGQAADRSPHPTTKPLALMLELVGLFSEPGELVLDPFAGSGSTGAACLRLGRRFLGYERDPRWAELARKRLGAEMSGSTLKAALAGQVPLFGK
jgi:site-specific DNA-methyltransferase (adenine-specific)